jgi:hypothetical protein
MNVGQTIVGGIIGGVISLLLIWLLFGVFGLPLVAGNVYIGVALAGFFSSFFAIIFNCNGGSAKD